MIRFQYDSMRSFAYFVDDFIVVHVLKDLLETYSTQPQPNPIDGSLGKLLAEFDENSMLLAKSNGISDQTALQRKRQLRVQIDQIS